MTTEPSTRPPRFAVVDVETSGLSHRRHRILQLGVVTTDGERIIDRWSALVRLRHPLQRIGPRRVHGIRRRDLRRDGTSMRVALAELARRVDGAVFTAHNAAFDAAFIERAARHEGIALTLDPVLCTLTLSRRLDPERHRSHRLADVCRRYDVPLERAHDALHDATATANVLPHLLAAHGVAPGDDLGDLFEPRATPPATVRAGGVQLDGS